MTHAEQPPNPPDFYEVLRQRDGIMTAEEFARKMKEADRGGDIESNHCEADDLMCLVLRQLGYGAGVDVFDEMDKWYA